MKKLLAILLALICLTASANAQKVISFKRWQSNLSLAAGTNYEGLSGQIALDTRFQTSSFGFTTAISYSQRTIGINSPIGQFDGQFSGFIFEIDGYYSLYRFLVPAPIDIKPYIGILYALESVKRPDNKKDKYNSFGNSFGVTLQYYFSGAISLLIKQNGYYIYNTPLGELHGSTLVGLSFML